MVCISNAKVYYNEWGILMIRALPGTSYGKSPYDNPLLHTLQNIDDVNNIVLTPAMIISLAWKYGLTPRQVEDAYEDAVAWQGKRI